MSSKILLLVIKFNTNSFSNPIAQYDGTCTGDLLMGMYSKCLVTVVGQYDTVTLFNFKCCGDSFFFSLSLSVSLLTGQIVAQNS